MSLVSDAPSFFHFCLGLSCNFLVLRICIRYEQNNVPFVKQRGKIIKAVSFKKRKLIKTFCSRNAGLAIYRVAQKPDCKGATVLLPVISPNTDRSSQLFFLPHTQQ